MQRSFLVRASRKAREMRWQRIASVAERREMMSVKMVYGRPVRVRAIVNSTCIYYWRLLAIYLILMLADLGEYIC